MEVYRNRPIEQAAGLVQPRGQAEPVGAFMAVVAAKRFFAGLAQLFAKHKHLPLDIAGLVDHQRTVIGLDRAPARGARHESGTTSFRTSSASSAVGACSSSVRSETEQRTLRSVSRSSAGRVTITWPPSTTTASPRWATAACKASPSTVPVTWSDTPSRGDTPRRCMASASRVIRNVLIFPSRSMTLANGRSVNSSSASGSAIRAAVSTGAAAAFLISTFAADAAAPGGVPPAEPLLPGVPLAELVPPSALELAVGGLAGAGDPAVEAVGTGGFPGAVGEDDFEGAAAIAAFESAGFSPLAAGWLLATTPGAVARDLLRTSPEPERRNAAGASGPAGDADAAPSDDFMFMGRGKASAAGFLSSEEAMPCRLAGPVSGVARWATAYHSAPRGRQHRDRASPQQPRPPEAARHLTRAKQSQKQP